MRLQGWFQKCPEIENTTNRCMPSINLEPIRKPYQCEKEERVRQISFFSNRANWQRSDRREEREGRNREAYPAVRFHPQSSKNTRTGCRPFNCVELQENSIRRDKNNRVLNRPLAEFFDERDRFFRSFEATDFIDKLLGVEQAIERA